jgi:iron complex transport system ATP-binding protein
VGLALALIRDPHLLLLDEPTSALDLHWRMVVLDLVQERVQQQGGIAVAAIHDLDLAARYCTQLIMLEQGKVIAAGKVVDVLTPETIARVFKVESVVEESAMGYPSVQVVRPIR